MEVPVESLSDSDQQYTLAQFDPSVAASAQGANSVQADFSSSSSIGGCGGCGFCAACTGA